MASFKAGDRVRLAARQVTAEDEKSGLYYSYFAELTGAVDMVYGDGSVCVSVDLESLSEQARDRHLAMQEAERKKWLEGLSGEARNRLTPEQSSSDSATRYWYPGMTSSPQRVANPRAASVRRRPLPRMSRMPLGPRRRVPRARLNRNAFARKRNPRQDAQAPRISPRPKKSISSP